MVLFWNNFVWTNSQLLISYDCPTSSGMHHDHDHRHCCSYPHQQLASNYSTAWHTTAELPRVGNGGGEEEEEEEKKQQYAYYQYKLTLYGDSYTESLIKRAQQLSQNRDLATS